MTTFIATSDWHIGARLETAGAAAQDFREARVETARRIVALAESEGAGALFLLGDTFEGDRVGIEDVERTARLLGEASCPVYVLPGNHDWWHRGGVIQAFERAAEAWAHVHVLHEPARPLVVDGLSGATFYPCPVLLPHDVADPTAWIPERTPHDGARIGLIHGAFDWAEWGGRVPERVAEQRDLDLAVLGDWHKPVDGPDGKTFYCGSHEPGGFDEEHEGMVLVVDVEDGHATPRRVPVGRLAWRRIVLALESTSVEGAGLEPLEQALAELDTPEPKRTALRLRLSGRLTLDEQEALEARLEALREGGWAHFEVVSEVELEGEMDLSAFEEGALRAVATRIWNGDAEPAVKRRALSRLRAHVEATR